MDALVIVGTLLDYQTAFFIVAIHPLLLEFIFGIAVFYWRETIFQNPKLSAVLIPISLAVLIYINSIEITFSRVFAYGIPALLFFIGMLSLESLFKKNSASTVYKIAKELGDSSYSLYLVHPFSLVIMSIILSKLGVNNIGSIFVAILILGSVVSGHLCFLLIEKNLARAFNKKPRSKPYLE